MMTSSELLNKENTDIIKPQGEQSNKEIVPTDYEWHDYVMGKFQESELINGHPSTDALRRVGELLLGDLGIRCQNVQVPNQDNGNRAVIECTVSYGGQPGKRYVTDLADADQSNTPKQFHNYLIATASTRAEGRCLRKALRLRKVLAAEELSDESMDAISIMTTTDKPQPQQIAAIKTMVNRLSINMADFLSHYQIKAVDEISFADAADAIQQLNMYQNGRLPIPEAIKSPVLDN